jgi:hypothetical protein
MGAANLVLFREGVISVIARHVGSSERHPQVTVLALRRARS